MSDEQPALLRHIPPVDELLARPAVAEAAARHGRRQLVQDLRAALDRLRADLRGRAPAPDGETIAREAGETADFVARRLEARSHGGLVEVLNATGVIVHTNLGRAPLGEAALQRLAERGAGATNLEMDLGTGRRGGRADGAHELLARLTGAESALVVNNNAAALLLALSTLAEGGAVIVSRGELVEIGGSFRIPDVCRKAGVRLVEVGTTNRTRVSDYREALDAIGAGPRAVLLKVHPSNFRVVGFTEEAPLAELVRLARERGVPAVMDQGSGVLEDLSPLGIEGETPVPDLVASGADLVLFSGDKLFGGPQAGCLVGKRDAVEACRRNPLFRALRPGRLVLLALEATAWEHHAGRPDAVPVLAQLRMPASVVAARAERVLLRLVAAGVSRDTLAVEEASSTSGGGSSPTSRIPTHVLRVAATRPDDLAALLRSGSPAVVARIEDGALLLDLRTVPPARDEALADALAAALTG